MEFLYIDMIANIPYSGKFVGGSLRIDLFRTFGERKFGELIERSANRLLIASTNLVW